MSDYLMAQLVQDYAYDDPPTCAYQTYGGSLEQPPEWCEEDVVPGSDYCVLHRALDDDPPGDY